MTPDSSDDDFADRFWITGKALDRHVELEAAQQEFERLFDHKGDDRSMVVVGGAFLETVLEHILITFLMDDEKEVAELLRHDQPLGTYAGRTRMVYCLGLIPKLVRADLALAGRIRNRFAHDLYASFDDPQIASWCKGLQWHRRVYMAPPEDAPARDLFYVGVHQLVGYLNGVVSIARGEKRQSREG